MDSSTIEGIVRSAVALFGKTSTHAVTITDLPEQDKIDLHDQRYIKLVHDIKALLKELQPITFCNNTDDFALVLRTIRETDQFAMMHILSAMSKLRGLYLIGDTLTRWVEITKQRKPQVAATPD